jgi:Cu(I)/Ag(I) efflux system membrane fusion protein
VIARRVNTGDYVSAGTVLYEIADLSKVWVLFDAYESDLQFLRKGKKITFTLQAFPGSEFSGIIAFIDPVIDPVTRVAKVRVEVPNKSDRLKPEMFASGVVSSDLDEYRDEIVIPRSAVLWTGKRSIVYVKQPDTDEPVFKMREIELGPSLGESYVVINGLTDGEEIVTSGTFSVDASAQLEGKSSMMNPGGVKVSTGHNHGEMTNQGVDTPENSPKGTEKTDIKKISISMDFIMQLNDVYDHYIILKNALVESNPEKAGQESDKLKEALSKTDMKLLSGDAHTKWMDLLESLNNAISTISKSVEIEKQRAAFSDLSDQLYSTIKTFGLIEKTVYYQFCPMAKDGKGANWLSEINDIRNPYYGESMLTCGETKETLKY